ncbi:dienelactone hydrolase family protein [Serinicoccus chungangensis]|uniref:dienelactone hydrolase family protein n=1 Tax=Serinicoccus chungangensis TaxID=767452 RepID=UPI001117D820|nr:lysophospholipase [Serinicoccus chungangensis]
MTPRLVDIRRHPRPAARVLVLHGGQQHGTEPTSWRQLSVLRSRVLAFALARAGAPHRLDVRLLRYAVRGWNDGAPLRDARWALDRLRAEDAALPTGLLGYSMGGRTALRLAEEVETLVTAAAWVDRSDLPLLRPPRGGRVLMLHGARDEVTSPEGTLAAAERLRRLGADVGVRTDLDDTHGLVRHARTWHRLAADHLVEELTGSARERHT